MHAAFSLCSDGIIYINVAQMCLRMMSVCVCKKNESLNFAECTDMCLFF